MKLHRNLKKNTFVGAVLQGHIPADHWRTDPPEVRFPMMYNGKLSERLVSVFDVTHSAFVRSMCRNFHCIAACTRKLGTETDKM